MAFVAGAAFGIYSELEHFFYVERVLFFVVVAVREAVAHLADLVAFTARVGQSGDARKVLFCSVMALVERTEAFVGTES